MTEPYRILALDGGGMRGIFTAACLAHLEHVLSQRLAPRFDLLVGTSSGGLIALGLASGKTAEEMLAFFRDKGRVIFSRRRRLRGVFGPQYDRAPLDRVLESEFGADTTMNDLDRPVCVAAHELVAGTTRVFKDDHHADLHGGSDRRVWKVAAATSAAPTYFAPVQVGTADSHVDGGIWANNPAMIGIIEAVKYGGASIEGIHLLSIGTTSEVFRVSSHEKATKMGVAAWMLRGRDLLLGGGVSMASHLQAELLLSPQRYIRIDDHLAQGYRLDDHVGARSLQEIGEQHARRMRGPVSKLLGLSVT